MTRELTHIMEFEHVIRVDDAGNVHEDVPNERAYWAPDVYVDYSEGTTEVSVMSEGWSLMSGYSGQDRYSGPIMHPSEHIGGGMERDILSTPGYYVSVIVYDINDDTGDNIDGWAVAYKEEANDNADRL